MIPTGYSEVTVAFSGPSPKAGRLAVTTFGVFGPPDSTTGGQVVAAITDNLWPALGSSSASMVSVTLRDEATEYQALPTPVTGGVNLALPPPNVTLLVAKQTARRGRKYAGRMFPPWMVYEQTYDGAGIMGSTDLTSYQAAFNGFHNDLFLSSPLVLLHEDATTPTLISYLAVSAVAATQRRRLR